MNHSLEFLKALHSMWIAICAMIGAFVGLTSPALLLLWAVVEWTR